MSIILLQHPADPGGVLYGKLEHDQLHWSLGHLVILIQVAVRVQGAEQRRIMDIVDSGPEKIVS